MLRPVCILKWLNSTTLESGLIDLHTITYDVELVVGQSPTTMLKLLPAAAGTQLIAVLCFEDGF